MSSPEPASFPPYTYVPGGRWPHPTASPEGHSRHVRQIPAAAIADGNWSASPAYLRGLALFNAGYYWEAHEAWESLWHAHGRRGAVAMVIQALIKLAAAGVKVREGRPGGVRSHALARHCFSRNRDVREVAFSLVWIFRSGPSEPGRSPTIRPLARVLPRRRFSLHLISGLLLADGPGGRVGLQSEHAENR